MDTSYIIQKNIEGNLDNYNKWIFSLIKPYLGSRIFDTGCSIGNITQLYLENTFVYGMDISREAIAEIKQKFKHKKNFSAEVGDLGKLNVGKMKEKQFDTIVCINVLEHVEDDKKVIQDFFDILKPGGKVILYVPAFNILFGTMDEADHHYRRYTKKSLNAVFKNTDFVLVENRYVNIFGIIGWFINGRILRKKFISSEKYKIYNAIIPYLRAFENTFPPPFGLSIFAVYQKKELSIKYHKKSHSKEVYRNPIQ